MLKQALANIARGYANNCIIPGIIRRSAAKQFDSNDALFQRLGMPSNCLVNDVLKKLSAAMTSSKRSSLNNLFDMLLKQENVFLCLRDFR